MNPSHVRARIIQDHVALRQRLLELEDAAIAMMADEAKTPTVCELVRHLLIVVGEHTALEDAILAPALMEVDAWGQVRAAQLLHHHQSQRAQLAELSTLFALPRVSRDVALTTTQAIVNDLRSDMEHEEREILSADLLRDDVVAVTAECG
jgi:hypothetical protein